MKYTLTEPQRETYLRYAALRLPRHTSYPAAPYWRDEFGASAGDAALGRAARREGPISLYLHCLYCEQLCYFCACNKVIRPKRDGNADLRFVDAHVDQLLAEIDAKVAALGRRRALAQIHLGGGSPTYLPVPSLRRLLSGIRGRFELTPDAEWAVEVDPRITSVEQLAAMREEGVNRLSLGIQDFDPVVQEAVNRIQPFEMVREFVATCRGLGYRDINFDLIYAMPFQSPESMAGTLAKTIELAPDRIAFYRLAVIPEMFKWQKTFKPGDLPSGEVPMRMFLEAWEALEAGGYEFIGLDHFARPDEALAKARREGSLRRSFQGMTTGRDLEVVGVGPAAISILEDAFVQNAKTADEWLSELKAGRNPAQRGMDLSREDRLRRDLLQEFYGYAVLRKGPLEQAWGIDFDEHFADELARLGELEKEGLVELREDEIRADTVLGRLLLRVPASVFDAYLPREAYKSGLGASESSAVG